MRTLLALILVLPALAAETPPLKVSLNGRFLVHADGTPFFYLADTAWELFHRLDRKQAVEYLNVRASQKFNVVQAVALAELDGLTDPNAYGKLPLTGKDPARPAPDYWNHVEYIIDQANQRGIYIALLPTWGSWVTRGKSDDPIFTPRTAQVYGEFLGKRFGRKGIIWILGGDRVPDGVEEIWRALARGIAIGVSGKEDYGAVLMSFHPRGGGTSSTAFHHDAWLGFNMQQTGHGLAAQVQSWARIASDYNLTPVKPVLDGEPLYEDHPLAFRARDNGYSFDAHVRQRAYWDVFAGACGHTYGNHSVWQMFSPGKKPINGPLFFWNEAIHRPGAAQMQYLRSLIESRPFLSRVPDQSIVADALEGADHISATRGDGYLFVYTPQGRKFSVNLGKISGTRLNGYWYNPRNGSSIAVGSIDNQGTHAFAAPSEGFGSDWVLILDDESKHFSTPGPGAGRI